MSETERDHVSIEPTNTSLQAPPAVNAVVHPLLNVAPPVTAAPGPLFNMGESFPLLEEAARAYQLLRSPRRREFAGRDHEDPAAFLRHCEDAFARDHVGEDQRVGYVVSQLREAAADWWNKLGYDLAYPIFRAELLRQFDSPILLTQLRGRFYTQKQGENEPAALFLRNKQQLANRVRRDISEDELMVTCRSLLRVDLQREMYADRSATFEELVQNAATLEGLAPRRQAPTPRSAGRPPKCWHCPDFHRNADCPHNPRNRAQGNAAGAVQGREPAV